MRVVLYEPSGSGGIFHYTFELAESLSRAQGDVTVFTRSGHELTGLKRDFEIKDQLEKSRIKSFLTLFKAQRKEVIEGSQNSARVNDSTDRNNLRVGKRRDKVLAVRRIVLWVELVYAFWMQRPQVIHFQWLSDPQKDYYLIQFLKFLGFKVVYTAHNLLPHGSVPGHKKVFQRIYQLVDKVVVHATRNKEEMVDEFAIDPNKIAVIPHGAYRLFYRDSSTTKERARQELGIPDHKRVILFFGSIRRYKGLEYLVRAFQMVREKLENVMLLIVGEVPPADAEEVEYYSKFLAAVENEEDVVPRRGYIDFDKVGDYFTASDVVVLPYLKTYQSGVLLLAYAAGKPVVVTDTGGLAEVVEEGKSGFVVSPMNAEHLAQAIISVIADPSRAEEMGRYAKHLSVEKYSWDEVARKTLEVYRSVIHD